MGTVLSGRVVMGNERREGEGVEGENKEIVLDMTVHLQPVE